MTMAGDGQQDARFSVSFAKDGLGNDNRQSLLAGLDVQEIDEDDA